MWNTKECLTIYTNSCAEFFGICVALFETTCNEDIASGMEKREREPLESWVLFTGC